MRIKKVFNAVVLAFLIISLSLAVMILPSFITEGVSRISLEQKLDLELVLDTSKDIELIFFGYAGCRNICTPRLHDIAQWYTTLSPESKKHLGVKFMDLSVPLKKELPDEFAKAFHKDFQGVFLDNATLRTYTRAFNVYFSSSLMDETEIDHTTHLYLVTRTPQSKELRFIYTAYPFDFAQIEHDIGQLIRE